LDVGGVGGEERRTADHSALIPGLGRAHAVKECGGRETMKSGNSGDDLHKEVEH